MNSKRTVFLLIVLTVSMVFTGCNAINGAFDSLFLSTPEVEAKDLAPYTGDTPETDDDVIEGFFGGMMIAMSPATGMMSRSLGSDYEEVVNILDLTIPGFAESRAVEADSRKASFGVDVSITDEEFDGDPGEGDLTVTEASVSVGVKLDSIDPDEMTEAEADFKLKLELILEDVINGDATINELNFNVNAKGNLKAEIGDDGPESVDFYAAADVSIGFSLSVPGENVSGKYILNFNYVQSGTVTEDDMNTGDLTGDAEDVSLTIEVYNNSNKLVKSVEYNQTQLMDM